MRGVILKDIKAILLPLPKWSSRNFNGILILIIAVILAESCGFKQDQAKESFRSNSFPNSNVNVILSDSQFKKIEFNLSDYRFQDIDSSIYTHNYPGKYSIWDYCLDYKAQNLFLLGEENYYKINLTTKVMEVKHVAFLENYHGYKKKLLFSKKEGIGLILYEIKTAHKPIANKYIFFAQLNGSNDFELIAKVKLNDGAIIDDSDFRNAYGWMHRNDSIVIDFYDRDCLFIMKNKLLATYNAQADLYYKLDVDRGELSFKHCTRQKQVGEPSACYFHFQNIQIKDDFFSIAGTGKGMINHGNYYTPDGKYLSLRQGKWHSSGYPPGDLLIVNSGKQGYVKRKNKIILYFQ